MQQIGGTTRAPYTLCSACKERDCEMCDRSEECRCSCHRNFEGSLVDNAVVYWVPQAGSEGRKKWLGRHQPILPDTVHLHVQLVKGVPRWVVSPRGSSVCATPGRCKVVNLSPLAPSS